MHPNWRKYRLGDLGRIVTGRTPRTSKPYYFGDKYPFITSSDMDGRKKAASTQRYLSEEGAKLLQRNLIPSGSVAVSCIGWQMGKSIMTCRPSFTNQQLNTILPNEKVGRPHRKQHPPHRHPGGDGPVALPRVVRSLPIPEARGGAHECRGTCLSRKLDLSLNKF
jgi:hypothetical protein